MDKKVYRRLQHDFENTTNILTALGDEKRQAILMAFLKKESCGGIRVPELTEITQLSRPAVSHHLKILKDAGILTVKTEGTKNYYSLSHSMDIELEKLNELLSNILDILDKKDDG